MLNITSRSRYFSSVTTLLLFKVPRAISIENLTADHSILHTNASNKSGSHNLKSAFDYQIYAQWSSNHQLPEKATSRYIVCAAGEGGSEISREELIISNIETVLAFIADGGFKHCFAASIEYAHAISLSNFESIYIVPMTARMKFLQGTLQSASENNAVQKVFNFNLCHNRGDDGIDIGICNDCEWNYIEDSTILNVKMRNKLPKDVIEILDTVASHQSVCSVEFIYDQKKDVIFRGRSLSVSTTMKSPCTILTKINEFEEGGDQLSLECEMSIEDGGQIIPIQGNVGNDVISGVSTFVSKEALVAPGNIFIPDGASIKMSQKGPKGRAKFATTIGDKPILVVRVIAPDARTTLTAAQLSDSVFGTSGDPVNLKSQYASCSYNKLNVIPAPDQSSPGPVTNGVVTVRITQNVSGAGDSAIRNAVGSALRAAGFSLPGNNHHVMYCLPPGTGGGWIAYAYINSWLSVYNDNWCSYVSGQMHEIGHNLDLAHSGEGSNEYADQSGMMGFSYSSDDSPVMCFNAPKNWQLGWYTDRLATANSNWEGALVGIAEYDLSMANQQYVALLVPSDVLGGSDDYYVSFNRSKGGTCNSGTREGANQVLIHKRRQGTGYAKSTLMAKMSSGNSYVIPSSSITIQVSINIAANTKIDPSTANVKVIMPTSSPTIKSTIAPTQNPTKSAMPTKAPTAKKTAAPTIAPTQSPTKSAMPTKVPTAGPTIAPTASVKPSSFPSFRPTAKPIVSTATPTNAPSNFPTIVTFIRQKVADDSCPPGYNPIYDIPTCIKASKYLGITNNPANNGDDYPANPAVCFVTFVDLSTGELTTFSKSQVNSNHFAQAAWICKSIATKSPTPEPTTKSPTPKPTSIKLKRCIKRVTNKRNNQKAKYDRANKLAMQACKDAGTRADVKLCREKQGKRYKKQNNAIAKKARNGRLSCRRKFS